VGEQLNRTRLQVAGERREFAVTRPSAHDFAMLEELSFIRREAQSEADQAYADWHVSPNGETWTIYLAARDRADAAQDELATWARQLAA
jgi:hypothetical protein